MDCQIFHTMTTFKQTVCRQLGLSALRLTLWGLAMAWLLGGMPSLAANPAEPSPDAVLKTSVQEWVGRQQGVRPEQVQLVPLDNRVRVQPCSRALVMDNPFASTETVRVRCPDPVWQLYIRVQQISSNPDAAQSGAGSRRAVVVATQALVRGMTVQPTDVKVQEVLLPAGGGSFMEQVSQAVHSEILRDVPAGTPLKTTDLRPLVLVKRGQIVQFAVGRKTGFVVTAQLEALQDGRMGEQIKLKNPESGRTLIGVVRGPGAVDGL